MLDCTHPRFKCMRCMREYTMEELLENHMDHVIVELRSRSFPESPDIIPVSSQEHPAWQDIPVETYAELVKHIGDLRE